MTCQWSSYSFLWFSYRKCWYSVRGDLKKVLRRSSTLCIECIFVTYKSVPYTSAKGLFILLVMDPCCDGCSLTWPIGNHNQDRLVRYRSIHFRRRFDNKFENYALSSIASMMKHSRCSMKCSTGTGNLLRWKLRSPHSLDGCITPQVLIPSNLCPFFKSRKKSVFNTSTFCETWF